MTVVTKQILRNSALVLAVAAAPAAAVDGVVEINVARAQTGGVTPGDAPGYPVTISQPGSYRLTSNLLVPNEFFTAIEVTVDDVTVDLNGFWIRGPGLAGTGIGIDAPNRIGTHLRNGLIKGMGSHGAVLGLAGSVTDVTFYSNGGDGLNSSSSLIITRVIAAWNGGDGIQAGATSLVNNASAQANQGYGIHAPSGATVDGTYSQGNVLGGMLLGSSSLVRGSTVIGNLGPGIQTGSTSYVTRCILAANSGAELIFPNSTASYSENVINGTVTSGLQLPPNNCNGVLCP